MDKAGFWLMVMVAAVIGVWLTKFIAAQTNVQGFRAFANAL